MVKDSKTRFVSPKTWERIEQWSRRKPVFALMGEFSAGKSTLMNFLLRKQALPTQVTATQLPPVWFSWGNRPAYVKYHDGSTRTIELDQLETVGINDVQFIRIFLEADILEAVDLIDTPGISDPKISTDVWRRAVGQANGVLWCTHSTQAWRETERATWVSLPERLQHNSLLLVTRADALNQKDRQKVLRRVNREAGHLFNRSILFSARDAILARDKTGDAEMWARSGGGKMVDSFLEITEQIMDNRADMLSRYQIDKSLPGGARVQPLRPAKTSEAETTTLRLVETVDQDADAPDVVTSFPVRPARVERREDEAGRERIGAEEAEKLRAEMTSEPEETGDDLRAYFRETNDDPLDLNVLARPGDDVDEFEFMAEDDEDDQDQMDLAEDEQEEDEPELIVIASEETEDPEEAASDIEASVSSITALLAEQSQNADQEYEPEPESNALAPTSVVTMVEEDAEDDAGETAPELTQLLNTPASMPLSALDMWREVVANEQLPEDAQGLRNVFAAFLSEFDQIAREHNDADQQDARPMRKVQENGGAEWHVL
ncbi:dynamin family protein [Ruegeria sp.]|uniref:dynamin family protein n=1 Tax=Ruegeria sp. TaxID=1879320 RepID=UPI0023195F50|nr:dynamin family protein [Ruegeria sp.]MDA7965143.1 dynamin family protein [Ruegeria sp.]